MARFDVELKRAGEPQIYRLVIEAADQAAADVTAANLAVMGGGAFESCTAAPCGSDHDHDGSYSAVGHSHSGSYEPANSNIQAHIASAHAPANAQKNSDITQAEIEAKLTGVISSHSHAGGGGGPTVKSGVVNLTAGGTALVTFTTPFGIGVTPHVVALSQFNTADTSTTLCAHTITNLGFTLKGAGNAAGNVAWIATDAGNA